MVADAGGSYGCKFLWRERNPQKKRCAPKSGEKYRKITAGLHLAHSTVQAECTLYELWAGEVTGSQAGYNGLELSRACIHNSAGSSTSKAHRQLVFWCQLPEPAPLPRLPPHRQVCLISPWRWRREDWPVCNLCKEPLLCSHIVTARDFSDYLVWHCIIFSRCLQLLSGLAYVIVRTNVPLLVRQLTTESTQPQVASLLKDPIALPFTQE